MAKKANLEKVDEDAMSYMDDIMSELNADDNRPESVPVNKQRGDQQEDDEDEIPPEDTDTEASEDEDQPEQEDESESNEDEEPPEEPTKPVKDKKPVTKEVTKIVGLKDELKRVKAENKAFREAQQKQIDAENRAKLVKQYQDQGYDEDVAQKNADQDIRLSNIEHRQKVFDFKEENYDVLRQYPEAKNDLDLIMQRCEATGMTAEQICRGMYERQEPIADKRARDAVKGKLPSTDTDDSVSSAMRGASRQVSQVLTPEQQAQKRFLESLRGSKYSTQEFLEVAKKHNLQGR